MPGETSSSRCPHGPRGCESSAPGESGYPREVDGCHLCKTRSRRCAPCRRALSAPQNWAPCAAVLRPT
eukprot:2599464-Pyramimonas_sp.AAC.1